MSGEPRDWYDAEPRTRDGMVAELQRIRRRTRARPLPALALAALATAAVTYRVATRPARHRALVVLALDEDTAAPKRDVPFDQLKAYVTSVLLPEAKLLELIERRDLYRLRATLGPQYALDELRGRLAIDIWKNSFVYYVEEDARALKSARIGVSVTDADPDLALALAHDVAGVIVASHTERQQHAAAARAAERARVREAAGAELRELGLAISVKQAALADAQRTGRGALAAALHVDLATLAYLERKAEQRRAQLAAASASPASAAGLDLRLSVVAERRPPRTPSSGFALVLAVAAIGAGSLVGAALVAGAFDARLHDAGDVTRLGLPVLGHVPAFRGDGAGSLVTRGAARPRTPPFQRWRT